MQILLQDMRYAFRQLLHSPGFTITAVLTLAIGIGANTASFSIMDAVVLRPLAVPQLNRVVVIYEQQNHRDPQLVTLANFADWQRQSRSFEELAIHKSRDMSLTGAGDAAHVQAEYASTAFFSVMRTTTLLGRVFNETETRPGGNNVAVLSYAFWQSHFAADAAVLGQQIELDQHPYTVIGVMPKSMQYPSTADFFLPFAPTPAELANRSAHDYKVIARLRKGVSAGQAQAEMNLISGQMSHAYPATNQGWSVKVESLLAGINGDLTPLYFSLVQGATLFVLLVVCANVANLQFARGLARRPEIAMRSALGAGRGRLLRQLLTENILLGLIGGGAGILFASGYLHLSEASMPDRVARFLAGWSNISLNRRALGFSLLLAILAGAVSGVLPAVAAMRVNLVDQLKSGSRAVVGSGRSRKLRNLLAMAQISLAMALVIGAGLMCKGMFSLLHMGDRYHPGQTLVFNVHLPVAGYDTPEKSAAWYRRSLETLRALPGAAHAEVASALPYSDEGWVDDCQIEKRPLIPGKSLSALRLPVSSGYFDAFGISLARGMTSGRLFSQSDDLQSAPVAIVSREFGARYFPGESPLGHRIRMGGGRPDRTPWMTIVGVVEEASYGIFDQSRPAAVYMSVAQLPPQGIAYALVARGDPLSIAPAARRALAVLDPTLPLDGVETYAQFIHERLTGLSYVAVTLGFDAMIALLLAAIGIFGVMANLVGERTREIGVRVALGARRADVLGMVLSQAGWLTGVGVCTGLMLGFALARLVANLLYGVRSGDPLVFATVTLAITGISLLASWLPAWRAAHIDPIAALRDE